MPAIAGRCFFFSLTVAGAPPSCFRFFGTAPLGVSPFSRFLGPLG